MRTALFILVFGFGACLVMRLAAFFEHQTARKREERELKQAAQRWGKTS